MTDESLFAAALEQPDRAAREAFLVEECAQDALRRERLDRLLAAHDQAGPFLNARDSQATTQSFSEPEDDTADALGYLQPGARPDSLGRIGHYEVLEVLGRGGFGIVFRAFDDKLHRVVAVKMMRPSLAATSPARKRFLREAQSSAAVKHDNVVQVHAVEESPLPFLVMEFVDGETLQQRLDRTGPLDVAEVLRTGRQIAEGLAAAHEKGLIHRDIKPANVLVDGGPSGRVKLTDFGLARAADDASISQSGIVAGTPMYMAPEQAKGETLDARADLFSLGSVLYALLTGRPPFRAESTLAVLKRVVDDTPRPIRDVIPEVPAWLCRIVEKLHAKNPAERYQTSREAAEVLADCERQMQTSRGLTDFSRIPKAKAVRSPNWRAFVAAGMVLGAVVLTAMTSAMLLSQWRDRERLELERRVLEEERANARPEPPPSEVQGRWIARGGASGDLPLMFKPDDTVEMIFERDRFEFRVSGKPAEQLFGTFETLPSSRELLLHIPNQQVPVRCAYRIEGKNLRLDFAGLFGDATGQLAIHQRATSVNNLEQIGLALHNFETNRGALPPAATHRDGKSLLSWRVEVLPYIEQADLYAQFKRDEPWDSPHNKTLIPKMPKIFAHLGVRPAASGMTHLRVFVGPGTAFEPQANSPLGIPLRNFPDGNSLTLLVVEASEPVIWTSPDDLPYAKDKPLPKLGLSDGGANVLYADGSVKTVSPNASEKGLRAAISRNGGELDPLEEYSRPPRQAAPFYITFTRVPVLKVVDPAVRQSLEKSIAIQVELRDNAEKRHKTGQGSFQDVIEAEVGLIDSRLRLAEAEENREEEVLLLEQLVKWRSTESGLFKKLHDSGTISQTDFLQAKIRETRAQESLAKAKSAMKP